MSGISVLFHRDRRPVEPNALGEMLETMRHRGQDGLTGRLFDDVALGHASTVVLAEDEGVIQPIVSPRTDCAIVADVRLDNRDELLALLCDCPPGVSDAEIILRAYERWGLDTPQRLLGDFAFAIWDPRQQRMVCARDVAAQRTLYYRLDDRTFAAATEIQSLFQDPSVPLIPNEDRIVDSLVPYNLMLNMRDRADTYFVGVHCLQAAHLLVVDHRSSKIQRYWQIDPNALPHVRDHESDEQFRAVFFEAVRARLRTSRRIGIFLSGGLDSTSIACTAQTLIQQGRAAVPGFVGISATYPGLDCDERPFVEATRDMYGFETHFVEPNSELEALGPLLTGFRETPQIPTGGTRTYFRASADAGTPVVMTGEVADGVISGSPYLLDRLLRLGHFTAYRQQLTRLQALGYSRSRLMLLHSLAPILPIRILRYIAEADVRRDHRKISWRLTPTWLPKSLRSKLLERDLQERVGAQRNRAFQSISQQEPYSAIERPEAPYQPESWSGEVWRPFADRRLWEIILALPPETKINMRSNISYAASKQLLRRGLRDILPTAISERSTKPHFNETVTQWFSREWKGIEGLFTAVKKSRIEERGYVDSAAFLRSLRDLRGGSTGRDIILARHLLGIELWLRALEAPRTSCTMSPTIRVNRESLRMNSAYSALPKG